MRGLKYLIIALIALAFVVSQLLIGGTRLLYSIPACALLALAALATLWPRWKSEPTSRSACLLVTLLFCGYLIIRNQFSPVDYLARPDFFIILGALAVYLLVALFLNRSPHWLILFSTVLLLALAHVVIGVIQFKNGNQFMLLPWIHRLDETWRASGFYISPNHYAGLLEVVALIAICLAAWGKMKFTMKLLLGYAAGVCVLGLVLSGSRGGYLSFGFGLVVFMGVSLMLLRKIAPHRFALSLTAAIVVLLAMAGAGTYLVLQSDTLSARFGEINDPKNMRLLLWEAAMQQFALNPVWGTGSGTYYYYGRIFRDATVQNDPIYVHNDYLHLLAEYGVAGCLFFAIFLGVHLFTGGKNLRLLATEAAQGIRNNQLAFQLAALVSIAAYAVHSVVDFNLHIPANAFLMAWIFGMIANASISPAHVRELRNSRWNNSIRLVARVALGGTGVALLAYGLPKLPGEWFAEKARVALRNYQVPEARDYAKQALEHETRNPDIYYYAGEAAREMYASQWVPEDQLPAMGAESVEMFKKALNVFPQDVRSVIKMAHAYANLGQFDEAAAQLERAAELDPNVSILHAYRGLILHMQGLLFEAQMHYERAVQLDWQNQMAKAGLETVGKQLRGFDNLIVPADELNSTGDLTPEELAEIEAMELSPEESLPEESPADAPAPAQ